MRKILFSTFLTLLFAACSSTAEIDGFDKKSWQEDTFGCKGERLGQMDVFKSNSTALLSLTQNEIKEVLGKPDEHELYQRTRKFFRYYLEPSIKCDTSLTDKPQILQIRFNALGLCNEVFVKNEFSESKRQ